MTYPISATTPMSTQSSPAGLGGLGGLGGDDFLKLLVAQLKYQDPSNPTDASSFMAQTAQLTGVEKLTTIAAQQSQLLTAQLSTQASGLVGRTVEYLSPTGERLTGMVTAATFGTAPVLRIGTFDIPLSRITGEHSA